MNCSHNGQLLDVALIYDHPYIRRQSLGKQYYVGALKVWNLSYFLNGLELESGDYVAEKSSVGLRCTYPRSVHDIILRIDWEFGTRKLLAHISKILRHASDSRLQGLNAPIFLHLLEISSSLREEVIRRRVQAVIGHREHKGSIRS